MATNKQILNKLGLTLWMAAFVVMPNVSSAAPGTLSSVPLFTAANADPNILLHLDSSGSMRSVMAESDFNGVATYDAATTYDADPDDSIHDTCSAISGGGGLIPQNNDTSEVKLRVVDVSGTDTPKILVGGTTYFLGNDNSEGERCFDPALDYYAVLNKDMTSDYVEALYSGNYLNWYFTPDSTTGTWTDDKAQTRNRSDVAKASLESLVNSLSSVRVGASTFNSGAGVSIDEAIDDIGTGSQRADTITAINAKTPSGGTPLAETLTDIGRYFSNSDTGTSNCGGATGTKLTLHPGGVTGTENSTTNCTTILGNTNAVKSINGPIEYQCQSNFVILTTDGLATSDRNINANLQDYDGDCSEAARTAGGYNCDAGFDMKSTGTYDNTDGTASDFLDDVALALYEMDLRPDLDDDAGNEVTNNIRTYVVGFNSESVRNNQLLIDTAAQGGGDFIFAEDADQLQTAFNDATSAILNLIGSAAAVTFNTATLGANSAVYLALFNSSSWSGDLVAYDLNDATGAIESQTWSAATSLDALSDANALSQRVVLTYNGVEGIALSSGNWPANYQSPDTTKTTGGELSTAQLEDILKNAPNAYTTTNATEKAENVTYGKQVIDFLHGDTSNEGSLFRSRTSRLGDIVHAGPVFVGAPELNWPDGTNGTDLDTDGFPGSTNAYSIYKFNKSTDTNPGRADRPGVVYVGSNDGMLHGFATEDGDLGSAGDEVLAFAPLALFSSDATRGYHYLTESGYNHQYYVDLIPTISDIYVSGASAWQTILVGGLRGGARALYALNVTDPANFTETNADNIVMGQFTNADDADLGYTFSRPTIALTNAVNGSGEKRWGIIFGNGYNADTGGGATGEASLFVLFLDANTEDAGGWDIGVDYVKISTETGDTSTLNGLSTPTVVDLDSDSNVDRAYAGDLLGNMWAFDLTDTDPTNWAVATNSGGGSSVPTPLFAAGSSQPITSQPEVVLNSEGNNTTDAPNTLVLFGTGQYVASADNANLGTQAFYSVWDTGADNLTTAVLTAQTITESGSLRTVSSNAVAYVKSGSPNFGWYINLNTNSDGERVVTDPVIRGDIVYFNTSIPTDVTCSYGGTGWQMSVQYISGANPAYSIFDADGNGTISNDAAYSGTAFEQGLPAAPSFLSDRRYTPGTQTQSGSDVANDAVENISGMGTGRLSWEELFQ